MKRKNIIIEYNTIAPGLNFLVPPYWWHELLEMNIYAEEWDEIKIPQTHPLDGLFDLNILSLDARQSELHLRELQEKGDRAAIRINQQIKRAKEQFSAMVETNPLAQVFSVLNFDKITQTKMKILYCPQFSLNTMLDVFSTPQWKVVNLEIYKLVCQKEIIKKGERFKDFVIGVPVFMDECTEMENIHDMDFELGPMIKANIYIYNSYGLKYGVIGYFQRRLTYQEVMNHIFEGLNTITCHEDINISYFSKKTLFVMNNRQVYQNFITCNDDSARFLKQQLQWQPWFDNFSELAPYDKFEVFQFSGQPKPIESVFKRPNASIESFKNMDPSKKIKQNQTAFAGYTDADVKMTKGFQPMMIIQTTNNESMATKKGKQRLMKNGKPCIQTHSSTEEESPGSATRYYYSSQHRQRGKKGSRIHFPLWKSQYNPNALLRLSEIKMNEYISTPFSNAVKIMKKVNEKRVFLNGNCNKLVINEEGQMIEQENREQSRAERAESKDLTSVQKLLEELALEIVGGREDRKDKAQIGPIIEEEKEMINVEIQTVKNPVVDELDEIESREC